MNITNLVLENSVITPNGITVYYLQFALFLWNQKCIDNFQIKPQLDNSAVTL